MNSSFSKYYTHARTARQDIGNLAWSIRPHPNITYIGWLNRGNLGDEAMYRSHRQRLPTRYTLAKAPINSYGRRLASLTNQARTDTLLIGGGTLLGHVGWLKSIELARDLLRPRRVVVLGAGMEDVEFGINKGLTDREALKGWGRFLREAAFVGVRGPLSQSSLWSIGVDSVVVGDSALWLQDEPSGWLSRAATRSRPPYVALNIIGSTNGFDIDDGERQRQLHSYVEALQSVGIRVVLFGMERRDVREALRLQRLLPSADVLPWSSSVMNVRALIGRSALVVAERLHGAILAAAASVPFLVLAYKPKSYDFTESVHATDYCIRPEDVSAGLLLERSMAIIEAKQIDTRVYSAKAALDIKFDAAHEQWVRSAC